MGILLFKSRWRLTARFRKQLAPDDAYLSYYDIRLTKEDIDTLKNDWLTDNCIAFWEEYLEREELKRYPSSHIVLLRPSMAFMLMQTPNALTLKDVLPDFSKTTHIFLPINDARNVSVAEGGSHWSLLLVSVIDGVAFHYDSMTPSNYTEAQGATRQLSVLLGRALKFMNLEDSPQQENGSDCGVYVCILMRHLLMKKLLSANAREKVSMSMGGKLVDANGGRKEILRTIEGFRREGERRRSYVAPHHRLICPRFPYDYRGLRRPSRSVEASSSSFFKTVSTSSESSLSPAISSSSRFETASMTPQSSLSPEISSSSSFTTASSNPENHLISESVATSFSN